MRGGYRSCVPHCRRTGGRRFRHNQQRSTHLSAVVDALRLAWDQVVRAVGLAAEYDWAIAIALLLAVSVWLLRR